MFGFVLVTIVHDAPVQNAQPNTEKPKSLYPLFFASALQVACGLGLVNQVTETVLYILEDVLNGTVGDSS